MSGQPDDDFIEEMRALESSYLEHEDPIRRSGFGGGPIRWESERRPLTHGIDRSGSFLDVGCANGWLALCVRDWCRERGLEIESFGVDIGSELVAEAADRLSDTWAADAWRWVPPRRFTFVYSLLDLSPTDLIGNWLSRLASWVEPGGRLIIGSYGSVSRGVAPADVALAMRTAGLIVVGETSAADHTVTGFAWAGP
ncbi:MAG: methyltransferase domain-containing protein [Acidimicrobiia bacterium]|nr:methyltransferase domain-containing protein [Acidimicrobiia bacterium]